MAAHFHLGRYDMMTYMNVMMNGNVNVNLAGMGVVTLGCYFHFSFSRCGWLEERGGEGRKVENRTGERKTAERKTGERKTGERERGERKRE